MQVKTPSIPLLLLLGLDKAVRGDTNGGES